jgi:hypothetical protein
VVVDVPAWVDAVAWIALGLGTGSALVIAVDIATAERRQAMPIMNVVWPVTGLYFGPVGVGGYRRLGRTRSRVMAGPAQLDDGSQPPHDEAASHGRSGALSASHCGAGCVVGDIIGGWIIFATGWTLAGERLFAEYAVEFVLAWSLGIVFQYLSIRPGRPDGPARLAVIDAIKADTLSIVAFQVGMFAWMAITTVVIFGGPLPIDGPTYWFMMQIGLILGFITTFPINQWLVRSGIKHSM